jgi:hypothetical protein
MLWGGFYFGQVGWCPGLSVSECAKLSQDLGNFVLLFY